MQETSSRVIRLLGIVAARLCCIVEQLRRELGAAVGNVDQLDIGLTLRWPLGRGLFLSVADDFARP